MRPFLVFLVLLLIGGAAFYALALNREFAEPYLIDWGIDPDGVWTRGILKIVATVLVGVPIAGLMWSIAALGSDRAGTDIHGYTTLRLRAGARYFFSVAAFALAGLFIFVATEDSDVLAFNLFMIAFGCAFLFGGIWILIARVRYDNMAIFATEYTGIVRRHEWADLEALDINREAQEYHLRFRTGRKARISFYYQGVNDLIALAEEKLYRYA